MTSVNTPIMWTKNPLWRCPYGTHREIHGTTHLIILICQLENLVFISIALAQHVHLRFTNFATQQVWVLTMKIRR